MKLLAQKTNTPLGEPSICSHARFDTRTTDVSVPLEQTLKTPRTAWLNNLALIVAAFVGASPALGQQADRPPARILVGFSPGGTLDVVTRALADQLHGPLGRTVVVENKPGAGIKQFNFNDQIQLKTLELYLHNPTENEILKLINILTQITFVNIRCYRNGSINKLGYFTMSKLMDDLQLKMISELQKKNVPYKSYNS